MGTGHSQIWLCSSSTFLSVCVCSSACLPAACVYTHMMVRGGSRFSPTVWVLGIKLVIQLSGQGLYCHNCPPASLSFHEICAAVVCQIPFGSGRQSRRDWLWVGLSLSLRFGSDSCASNCAFKSSRACCTVRHGARLGGRTPQATPLVYAQGS